MIKKVLALVLVLALSLSFSTVAFADTDGNITGDGTVFNPVFKVVLATDLAFVIDRYQAKGTAGQIYTEAAFPLINNSSIPVMVQYNLQASYATTGTGAVTFVASSGNVYPNDNTKTTKDIFMKIQAAQAAEPDLTAGSTATTATSVLSTFADTTAASSFVTFDTTGAAKIAFALAKAQYASAGATDPDDISADGKGVAGLRFYADLNTYAPWANNDIKMTGTYKISGLLSTGYDALTYIDSTNAKQMIKPTGGSSQPSGFVNATESISKSSTTNKDFGFKMNGRTVQSVKYTTTADGSGTSFDLTNASYTINESANTITLIKTGSTSFFIPTNMPAVNGKFSIKFTFTDGTTSLCAFTVTT